MSGLKPSLLITDRGFTLLELLGATALLLLLAGTVAYAYIAILKAVDEQISRSQARGGINIALESVGVDLRHAFQLQINNTSKEIRFQVKENGIDKFYVYYLRSQKDNTCPSSTFDSTALYNLMRAPLQGGNISGTYNCGDGSSTIRNIAAPPSSDITLVGKILTFDITAKTKASSVRVMTSVKARN